MSKRSIDTEAIIHESEKTPELDPIEGAKRNLMGVFANSDSLFNEVEEAINNLISVVDENAIHQIREEISVYYPEQLFSPIPYMSYRCGNLWYKTIILPGETREEAYDRAFTYVRGMVKKQFEICRQEFWDRERNMSL